jgi:glycosyltransferase involved in cell wall biosynthesis
VVDSARQPILDLIREHLASLDARVVLVPGAARLNDIELCNRGLAERTGDAVLVSGSAIVSEDWLSELAAVAHSEERTACASPASDAECVWSSVGTNGARITGTGDATVVRAACTGLPRWTVMTVMSGPCVYLRNSALDAVGLLDARKPSLHAALAEWVLRAQSRGLVAKRANHAFVGGPAAAPADTRAAIARDPSVAVPDKLSRASEPRNDVSAPSLDARMVSHAIALEATGKLRVAYDIRHVPAEHVGTRTYAISLARALSLRPEVELTLLVRHPAQARGLKGRVVTPEQWTDDVALIHRPGQVVDRSELRLLFESSAHVVITYQDLIAFRIPLVFPDNSQFEQYRATSRLTLPAAQRIIAYSKSVAREIESEFGVPREEIPVVALGVEAEWFAGSGQRDWLIRSVLRLPRRYFFSVASDFPHKNLQTLLDAYARLRERWKNGEPPDLVLAGYSTGGRSGLYPRLETEQPDRGVIFLGPVSRHQLRVLYQDALALVFSSLYEGFGLPILEAMAAGTPVIAMPISAVPEVGGDCVLYCDGLSADGLARTMQRLAASESLRDNLRAKGKNWIDDFRWEQTAQATSEVYRSTVLRPSDRALQMRRLLREVIIDWSNTARPLKTLPGSEHRLDPAPPPMGVRSAWKSLQVAVSARARRELQRFRPQQFGERCPRPALPRGVGRDSDPQPSAGAMPACPALARFASSSGAQAKERSDLRHGR